MRYPSGRGAVLSALARFTQGTVIGVVGTAAGVALGVGAGEPPEDDTERPDLSLPLPFAAKIAALNGEMSTIATASAEPSTVELEGELPRWETMEGLERDYAGETREAATARNPSIQL